MNANLADYEQASCKRVQLSAHCPLPLAFTFLFFNTVVGVEDVSTGELL